jgi:hypothetical protein
MDRQQSVADISFARLATLTIFHSRGLSIYSKSTEASRCSSQAGTTAFKSKSRSDHNYSKRIDKNKTAKPAIKLAAKKLQQQQQ